MIETNQGKYYSTQEFLNKVQISETTLKKWMSSGKVHRVRLGNKRFFHEGEIDKLFMPVVQDISAVINDHE